MLPDGHGWQAVRRVVLVAAVAVLSAVPAAHAQYGGEVDVNAVVAPVTVRDASGRIVTNVARSRFHLYVDGMEVRIQDFALESDLPISLGFVLDTSGSMAGRKMAACQGFISAFLGERRQEDELALWTFGDERVLERFPFGMGWYLLPRVLETIRPWSTTALYDMIQRIPEVMERARHPRRAAILLTDGVDNASQMTAADATAIAEGLDDADLRARGGAATDVGRRVDLVRGRPEADRGGLRQGGISGSPRVGRCQSWRARCSTSCRRGSSSRSPLLESVSRSTARSRSRWTGTARPRGRGTPGRCRDDGARMRLNATSSEPQVPDAAAGRAPHHVCRAGEPVSGERRDRKLY